MSGEAVETLAPPGTPCVKCEYALDGLPIDGVCPECSEAIRSALDTSLLRYAPSRTLRELRWSVRLFRISIGITLATVLSILCIWLSGGGTGAKLLAVLVGVFVNAIAWLGAWWFIASGAGNSLAIRWRCGAAAFGFVFLIGSLVGMKFGFASLHDWVRTAVSGLCGVLSLQIVDHGFAVIADVAQRLPSAELAERARWTRKYLLFSVLLGTFGIAIGALLKTNAAVAGSAVMVASAVAAAVFLGIWVDVILRWSSAVERQITLARQRSESLEVAGTPTIG